MNVFRFLYVVFLLNYLARLLENQLFYYFAELLVLSVGFAAVLQKGLSFPGRQVLQYLFLSTVLFAIDSAFFDVLSVFTGFRYLLIPLMLFYVGRQYHVSVTSHKLDRFLKVLLYVSVPAGILGELVHLGGFQLLGRAGGDSFGGIFGPLGGSGILGMFITVIVTYFLVRKVYFKEHIAGLYSLVTTFLVLILIAESKIAVYLFILLMISAGTLVGKSLRKVLKISLIAGPFLYGYITLYEVVFPQWEAKLFEGDFLRGYLNLEQLSEGIYAPEQRGSETRDEYVVLENTRLTRLGAFAFSAVMVTKNWRLVLFGFGPGTAQFSRLYQSVIDRLGYKFYHLDFFAGPTILFEYGTVGVLLLTWVLVVVVLRTAKRIRSFQTNEEERTILLLVFLLAITLAVSLAYNSSFFLLTFGGLFWFFLGSRYHAIA